jgi:hypothetical protein
MKKIISLLMTVALLLGLTATISHAVVNTSSVPMSSHEMTCVVGGEEGKLDCDAIAAGAYALCKGLGGSWLACTVVAAGAYLGCLAANAL